MSPGLKAEFFDFTTRLKRLPNLGGRVAEVTRTDALIDYRPTRNPWPGLDGRFADTFASRHTGYMEVDTAGRYTLYLSSSDGSKLWLDGKLLINNDGLHPMRQRSRTVALSAGLHSLRVDYFENTGKAGLIVSWAGPGDREASHPRRQPVPGLSGKLNFALPFIESGKAFSFRGFRWGWGP